MTWIKRNLFFVVGGLIALALLGGAGFFLYSQSQKEAEVSTSLTSAIDRFTQLNERKPSVIEENVTLAKTEQERLQKFLEEVRATYGDYPAFTNVDSATFKTELETTIAELEKLSEHQGVRVPRRFAYTFAAQKASLVFEPADLIPWSYQLQEIKKLCEAVFNARVHSVINLRRAPTSKKDTGAAFLNRKAVTNTVVNAVVTPYEISFLGFSTELANVLDNLVRSTNAFLVKNINVERASSELLPPDTDTSSGQTYLPIPGAATPNAPEPPPRSTADRMRQRYGINPGGSGGGFNPAPQPVPNPFAPPARRGPETVLDERLLKFTMLVEAVRLLPQSAPPKRSK